MIEHMCLSDLFGDCVIYRKLEPPDSRLRGLVSLRAELGLPARRIPRKSEPEYAAVVTHLLRQAQAARGAACSLERLLYIGDTCLNDGTAARNLAAHLPMRAFIGEDKLKEPLCMETQGEFTLANRWAALGDFLKTVAGEGWRLDAATAVVLDVDKTAIGARGRNDKPIDQARVDAALDVVRATLGASFRMETFRPVYDELHKSTYHYFTTDNQDYLVYVALMVSAGVYAFDALLDDLTSGRLSAFEEFVTACESRLTDLPALGPIHAEVAANVRQGDPTPFKSFRFREYERTIARMNALPDDAPREQVLAEEITITSEVAAAALSLREQGALIFALSDKPDEASLPRPEAVGHGCLPLHRVKMKVM